MKTEYSTSTPQSQIVEDIVRFFRTDILNDETAELDPRDEIISLGLIDSMGIVRLLTHLQNALGIGEFARHDLTLDNFRSIEKIAAMIARYCVPAVAGGNALVMEQER